MEDQDVEKEVSHACIAVDVDGDGIADAIVSGEDADNDGIPDILQKGDALGHDARRLIKRFTSKKDTVEKGDLVELVKARRKERDSFLRLPFTVVFFLSFALFGTLHENISDSSMAQREIRNILEGQTFEGVAETSGHKNIDDMDSPEDIYNYLREVVLPVFVTPASVANKDTHRVLRYNQIIGGVLLQQIRRNDVSCAEEYPNQGPYKEDGAFGKHNPLLYDFICYPWDTESDQCFGPNAGSAGLVVEGFCPDSKLAAPAGGRRLLDGSEDVLDNAGNHSSLRRLDFVPGGGGTGGDSKGMLPPPENRSYYSVYIFEYEGLAKAKQKINDLEANTWIGVATSWVGVRLLIFNPTLATFVHATINVYMPPGGSILPKVVAQSFILEPYQSKAIIASDSFYGLCCLWLLLITMKKICRALRNRDALQMFVTDGWNFVDVFCVIGSLIVWGLWITINMELNTIKISAMDAREAEPVKDAQGQATPNAAHPKFVADLHKDCVALASRLATWRLVLCWYTLLISWKFLESFSAQPRLALVTDSIIKASSDFFHFFIVVFTLFNGYAVSGMIIFGRRLWNWSNLQLAFNETFLFLMGDVDYDELSGEYPLTAGVWFWTFVLLMMLLMLNMLMAIVMDVYTEVKGAVSDTDPIWDQLISIFKDFWGIVFGRKLSNANMLKNLLEAHDEEINVKTLMKIMGPGMAKTEAEILIKKTRDNVESQLKGNVTMVEALRMIGTVNTDVHAILQKINQLVGAEEQDKNLMLFNQGKLNTSDTEQEIKRMVAAAETRIEKVATHISQVDTCMKEALEFTAGRGGDLASRLLIIEELLLSQLNQRTSSARHARRATGSRGR